MEEHAIPSVWTSEYDVNTLVLAPRRRLSLHGLLSILQDAAWLHADALGCGFATMAARETLWVLTRQRLRMDVWPSWGEKLTIRTWARPFAGALAPRDFEILADGRRIGAATTLWLILDARTRRPQRNLPTIVFGPETSGLEAEKIPPETDLTDIDALTVKASDIDVNGHVNNTNYARWVLDALPAETLQTHTVTQYDVDFLSETRLGARVVVAGKADAERRRFQGRRAEDGKPVFAARLTLRRDDATTLPEPA